MLWKYLFIQKIKDRTECFIDDHFPCRSESCNRQQHVTNWIKMFILYLHMKTDRIKTGIDMRVMDDLTSQVHAPVGKPLARLIRVIHRALDPIAEPEFPRQMDRQPAGRRTKPFARISSIRPLWYAADEFGLDDMFHVEALAEMREGGIEMGPVCRFAGRARPSRS